MIDIHKESIIRCQINIEIFSRLMTNSAFSFVVADYGRSLKTLICDAPYLFVFAIND